MADKWDETRDFNYNIRKHAHAIGLHAEMMEGLRDIIKACLDKEDRTPEDMERCLDALNKMELESAELQNATKELNEYLRHSRFKRRERERESEKR